MSGKQYAGIVVIAAICALVGGAVSGWFFSTNPAYAATPLQTQVNDETSPIKASNIQADIITSERFELFDEKGNRRALLGLSTHGHTVFRLFGEDGKGHIGFSMFSDGINGELIMANAECKPRVRLEMMGGDCATLRLSARPESAKTWFEACYSPIGIVFQEGGNNIRSIWNDYTQDYANEPQSRK